MGWVLPYKQHIGLVLKSSIEVYKFVCSTAAILATETWAPNLSRDRFPFWAEDKLGPYIPACKMQIECCQLELTHPMHTQNLVTCLTP
jgi:hypothetical protein